MHSPRQTKLAAMVQERGFLSVADASAELDVSAVTIRSDLSALESAGIVQRVRGGALTVRSAEPPVEVSATTESAEKSVIARAAAGHVSSGMSVLIDVGSTTAAVARAIIARTDLHSVTLVTNSLTIALEAEAGIGRFDVIVTGGTLRPLQHSLVAPLANTVLNNIHADIAFIGCNGVSAVTGVTSMNSLEAEMKQAMMRSASQAVVVADHTKFGRTSLAHVGELSDFARVVSTTQVDPSTRAHMEETRATTLQLVPM